MRDSAKHDARLVKLTERELPPPHALGPTLTSATNINCKIDSLCFVVGVCNKSEPQALS